MTPDEIDAVCERYGISTFWCSPELGCMWTQDLYFKLPDPSTMTPREFENLVLLYVLEGTFTQ